MELDLKEVKSKIQESQNKKEEEAKISDSENTDNPTQNVT